MVHQVHIRCARQGNCTRLLWKPLVTSLYLRFWTGAELLLMSVTHSSYILECFRWNGWSCSQARIFHAKFPLFSYSVSSSDLPHCNFFSLTSLLTNKRELVSSKASSILCLAPCHSWLKSTSWLDGMFEFALSWRIALGHLGLFIFIFLSKTYSQWLALHPHSHFLQSFWNTEKCC